MTRKFFASALILTSALCADASPELKPEERVASKSAFTGRIVGNHVRMRSSAELESLIVQELNKGELVVIHSEKDDFYAVEPPSNIKGYVFRTFVIDGVIEGSRVNVRLAPDREAPVIGHLSTGNTINGAICKENTKWYEIAAPSETRFYVAKEFIEYAGKPELKRVHDKRRETAAQLLESADQLVTSEMRKAFKDIDFERMTQNFKTVINDYADFPEQANQAKQHLASAKEAYVQKKISFLEQKADGLAKGREATSYSDHSELSPADRMKVWEPMEEAIYLTWSAMHHAKTMDDFYNDQKLKAHSLSGIIEAYGEPVMMKPGNFVLKDENGVTKAFLYSTQLDLQELVGQSVSLSVNQRPNNNFAFPAYYVLDAE